MIVGSTHFPLKEGNSISTDSEAYKISDRLFQVEYAIEAVKLGSTAVGIRTNEGVVLAVEKRLTSPLLEPSSVEKILEVDSHIGAAVSGLIGGMFYVETRSHARRCSHTH